MAHLDINRVIGDAGRYGPDLWAIDAAVWFTHNWFNLSRQANRAQRDCQNFRHQITKIRDTVHF